MGKQARIRRERRDTTGLAGAFKRVMKRVQARVQAVELAMRDPSFAESLKARADLLVGTPGEITSEAMVVRLACQLLEERGVNPAGVLITCKLTFNRLQFWARLHPEAAMTAATEARLALAERRAGVPQSSAAV